MDSLVKLSDDQQAMLDNTAQKAQTYELIVVDSAESFESAADILKRIASRKKEVNDQRLSLTRPLDESKKNIMAIYKPPIDQLDEARRSIEGKMLSFTREQERIQSEAEEKARKEYEEEQARIRKNAEARAKRAEKKGEEEAAADIREQAEMTPPPPPPVVNIEKAKAKGISTRSTFNAEVTDLMALVKAVANGEQPLAYIKADTVKLNQQARSLGNELRVPGVRVNEKQSMTVRSA